MNTNFMQKPPRKAEGVFALRRKSIVQSAEKREFIHKMYINSGHTS